MQKNKEQEIVLIKLNQIASVKNSANDWKEIIPDLESKEMEWYGIHYAHFTSVKTLCTPLPPVNTFRTLLLYNILCPRVQLKKQMVRPKEGSQNGLDEGLAPVSAICSLWKQYLTKESLFSVVFATTTD